METADGRRVWDISPPLTPGLAVFPGDTPLEREVLARREAGDSVTLSALRATVHLGAHVDAPLHYGTGAAAVDAVPLDRLLGRCRLVRPPAGAARDGRLGAAGLAAALDTLAEALDGGPPALPRRVLVATGSYPDPTRWTDGFTALAPEAIDWLAAADVHTVGVDTPSIDPATSAELPAHAAVLRHDMTIIEGLALEGVPEGDYELIALPLRLVGFDGSPVRAVLRELPAAR
ncbi:MAG TPA: cyclase family protein [Gemmatimonadota bacterium]|nr:cyclase family protein [Gemmatimonadota bacterium]